MGGGEKGRGGPGRGGKGKERVIMGVGDENKRCAVGGGEKGREGERRGRKRKGKGGEGRPVARLLVETDYS